MTRVIARGEAIVGVGHHVRAGAAHAEIMALAQAGEAARGAELYVTLEPCNHTGRTGPCAQALVDAGYPDGPDTRRDVVRLLDHGPAAARRSEGGGLC